MTCEYTQPVSEGLESQHVPWALLHPSLFDRGEGQHYKTQGPHWFPQGTLNAVPLTLLPVDMLTGPSITWSVLLAANCLPHDCIVDGLACDSGALHTRHLFLPWVRPECAPPCFTPSRRPDRATGTSLPGRVGPVLQWGCCSELFGPSLNSTVLAPNWTLGTQEWTTQTQCPVVTEWTFRYTLMGEQT